MKSGLVFALVVVCLLAVTGCSTSVDPTNPFDPSAASEKQAKGAVIGKVVLEAGTAASGVTVLLKGTAYTTQTDETGGFTLRPVQPGQYTLVVTPGASHEAAEQGGVVVGAGETVNVGDLFLRLLTGRLSGSVALKGGGVAAGAVVSVVSVAGTNDSRLTTHDSRLQNRPSERAGSAGTGGFRFASAAPTPPDWALRTASSGLKTHDTGLTDRCAGSDSTVDRTVAAGSDGVFSADRVPVGDYVVAATKDGYAPGLSTVVSVTKDSETTVPSLELAPITSVIHLYGGAAKDNEKYSNTPAIKEEILAFNSSEMRVGKAADLSSAEWETFSATRDDTLSDAEGEQSIFFQFRDAYCRQSPVYEAKIVYDKTAPEDAVVEVEDAATVGGKRFVSSQAVTLLLTATDALSGVEKIVVAADGTLEGKVAVDYETRRADNLTAGDGKKAVLVKFVDGAGNESDAVSADVYLDTTGSSGTVAARGVDVSGWVTSRNLDLLLSADDGAEGSGAAEMILSEDAAFAGAAWERFAPVRRWELSAGADGDRTVYAKFRDALGNESAASNATVKLDANAPSGPTISILEAPLTNKGTVTVELYADGASQYAVRTDGAFSAPDWKAYTAISPAKQSESVDLGSGDGLKTVYARFRDAAGNETAIVSATVEADRAAPQGPRVSIAEKPFAKTTQAALSLSAVGAARMCVYGDVAGACDPSSAVAEWETFQGQKVVVLTGTQASAEGENKTVKAVFADAAGNVSAEANDSTTYDAQGPANAGVTIVGKVRSATDGSDVEDQTVSYTADVKLVLSAQNATRVALSNDPTMDCSTARYFPVTFANGAATIAAYILNGGTGTKTAYACFADEAGNTTTVPATDQIYLDQSGPTGAAIKVNGGAAWTGAATVSLTDMTAADDHTGGIFMKLSNCGDFGSGAGCATTGWLTLAASYPTWVLPSGDGVKTVFMKVRDFAGNEGGVAAATVSLDGTAPQNAEIHVAQKPYVKDTQVDVVMSVGGATRMCIYGDVLNACTDPSPSTWELFRSNKRVSLTSTQGSPSGETKTVKAKFADEAGNVSGEASDSTTYDAVAPTTGTPPVTLKGRRVDEVSGSEVGDLLLSYKAEVDVELRASGATMVALSNMTVDCRTADYFPATFTGDLFTVLQWKLPGGGGTAEVYACFMDNAGNYISTAVKDDIYVDVEPPIGPYFVINDDDEITGTETVDLTYIDAFDDVAGGLFMKISNCFDFAATGCDTTAWLDLSDTYTGWTLRNSEGPLTVFMKVRDYAGHEGIPAEDMIVLDKTAPTAVSVTINGGDAWTFDPVVNMGMNVTGDVKEMQVSCDLAWDIDLEPWVSFTDVYQCFLDPATDGTKTVRVRFRDAAKNESEIKSDTIDLDQKPPEPPFLSTEDTVTSTTPFIVEIGVPSSDANFAEYQVRGGDVYKDWSGVGTGLLIPVSLYLDAANFIEVRGVDLAGNTSAEAQVVVIHDDTQPTAPEIFTADQFVNANTITIDLLAPSEDDNFKMYQLKGGPSYPDWSDTGAVSGFPFTLQQDALNVLCVRGADRAGLTGPEDCVNITEDSTRPTAPVLMADNAWAAATTIEVFLKQRATDLNFDHYEIRGGILEDFEPICPDVTDLCGGSQVQPAKFVYRDGADLDHLAAIAFDLRPGETTTLYLRAVDRAGNVGTADSLLVSERGIEPVSKTDSDDQLLAVHGDRIVVKRPYPTGYDSAKSLLVERGPDGLFGTADDDALLLSSAGANFTAVFGKRVGWTSMADGQVYVATAGIDNRWGTADDCREGAACAPIKVTNEGAAGFGQIAMFVGGILVTKQDITGRHLVLVAPGPDGEFNEAGAPGNDDVTTQLTFGAVGDGSPVIHNQTLAFWRDDAGIWKLMVFNPGADVALGTADDDLQEILTGASGPLAIHAPMDDSTPEGLNAIIYTANPSGPALEFWVVEAGPDGTFTAADETRKVAYTQSFYASAFNGTHLAYNEGSNGILVATPGPDNRWGTEDDPAPASTSVLAGQWVAGLSATALYVRTNQRGNPDITGQQLRQNRWFAVDAVPSGLSEPSLGGGLASFSKSGHAGVSVRDFAAHEERTIPAIAWGSSLSDRRIAGGGGDKNPYVVEPGADGVLGTGDDVEVQLSTTGRLYSPVNPTMRMRSVSLDGDLVSWVDGDPMGGYDIFLTAAGTDKEFGTADDCSVKLTDAVVTGDWVQVSEGRVVWADAGTVWVREEGPGGICDRASEGVFAFGGGGMASLSGRRLVIPALFEGAINLFMIETRDGKYSTLGDNVVEQLTHLPANEAPAEFWLSGDTLAWIDASYLHAEVFLMTIGDRAVYRVSRSLYTPTHLFNNKGTVVWREMRFGDGELFMSGDPR